MVSFRFVMFVELCYPYGSRLSTIPYCTVHERVYTYRFRVALVQIPTEDLASYLDERHSPYVFLLKQEISKSYTRNLIPLAFKKKVPHAKLLERGAKYAIGSRDSTAVNWTPRYQRWISFLLLFNHQRHWPMNQTTHWHYAYETDTVFTKLSRTEYGGLGRPQSGSGRFRAEKTFCSSGNLTPDSQSIS